MLSDALVKVARRWRRIGSLDDPAAYVRRVVVTTYLDDRRKAQRRRTDPYGDIELLDHRNEDKVIWKNDQYRFTENYQVTLQSNDTSEQESRAIQDIAVRFAESLVTNLLEGF